MSIAPTPPLETLSSTPQNTESGLDTEREAPEIGANSLSGAVEMEPIAKPATSKSLGKWRPFLSCGSALGLGVLLWHSLIKPAPRGTNLEGAGAAQIYLARSATLVVSAQKPPGALLRGKISLVADLMGRAPVSGAVARQLIEPGTRVKRGEAVMEISSGQAERPAPRVEAVQNQAEQSQIQASNAQTSLAGKVGAAQTQLQSAKERVAAAQAQIGVARDLVRRLQNGESVAITELPAPFRAKSTAKSAAVPDAVPDAPRPRRRRRRRSARSAPISTKTPETAPAPVENPAVAIALRQAQAAADAAREGTRDLQTARQMLVSAQTGVRFASEKLQATSLAVDAAEKAFEAKKVTGADVEAARSAQREAQAAATAAGKGLTSAQIELAKREKTAVTLQQYADKAQTEATSLSAASKVKISSETPSNETPSKATESSAEVDKTAAPEVAPQATRDPNAGRVTLAEAAQFVGAAVAESRSASRDADRIHAQIEDYQSQVTSSRTRIESATQNLASAQQKVLDSVPRPRFTAAAAPADGVVIWVSRLAREVGAGQSIFGLASGNKIGVSFEDKSGLWRGLKAGEKLPAMVAMAPVSSQNSASKPSATPGQNPTPKPSGTPIAGPTATGGSVASVQVTAITPPETVGKAALVTGDLQAGNPDGSGNSVGNGAANEAAASLRAGMDVLISVPQPNAKPTLSVPVSALVKRGEVNYLAVLSPISFPVPSPVSTPIGSEAKVETTAFHLKWQVVKTGRTDGLRQEIEMGLEAGARVVVMPGELESRGFSVPETVSEEPKTGTATVEPSLQPDIEIRLTGSEFV